jgi:hypothetical protein
MALLQRQYTEDLVLARRINGNIEKHSTDLQFASEQLKNEQINPPQTTTSTTTPRQRAAAAPSRPATRSQAARRDPQSARLDSAPAETKQTELMPPQGGSASGSEQSSETTSAVTPAHVVPAASRAPELAEVRQLASTNLAKKAAFGKSIEIAEKRSTAFELSPVL